MKIELRSICDSDKHFRTPIDEYLKRCSKTITITQLRPQKHGTQKQIIQKETKHIVTKLQKVSSDTAIHLMSPKGNQIDTTQRSSLLQPGSKHLFII